MENILLTTMEVAEKFRLQPSTIRRWCRTGVLPALKVGLQHRIREADVLELMRQLQEDTRAAR